MVVPTLKDLWPSNNRLISLQVKGLYRGMSSPLGGVAAINAITFGVYGNAVRSMQDPDSIYSIAIAGSTAGLVQVGTQKYAY